MAKSTSSTTIDAPLNFHQWLQGLLPQLAAGMAAPDSTVRFVQQLMMVCAGKLKQHAQPPGQMGAAGVGGAGGPGAAGLGAGAPGPNLGAPTAAPGGGAQNPMMAANPGLMAGSKTPTPDELRRMIQKQVS